MKFLSDSSGSQNGEMVGSYQQHDTHKLCELKTEYVFSRE